MTGPKEALLELQEASDLDRPPEGSGLHSNTVQLQTSWAGQEEKGECSCTANSTDRDLVGKGGKAAKEPKRAKGLDEES